MTPELKAIEALMGEWLGLDEAERQDRRREYAERIAALLECPCDEKN